MRRRSLTIALAASSAVALFVGIVVFVGRASNDVAACGPGFAAMGARCLVPSGACPSPLAFGPRGCDAPDVRVRVEETQMTIGPSDWEAEGRVSPRSAHVRAFYIDAFEVTMSRLARREVPDGARAAAAVSFAEATEFCAAHRGRVPTDDEWLAAAAGAAGRRYPWGETGAVCRRAAWGLATGPCARGATGADTAGAHPEGATASGIHDLAGNVAEWVAPSRGADAVTTRAASANGPTLPAARGGAWSTELATGLRTWQRLEIEASAHDPAVGFRCAYDAAE